MKIILGVFQRSFYALSKKYDLIDFSEFTSYKDLHNIGGCYYLLAKVNGALDECKECYFDLTAVIFELKDLSFNRVTIGELHLVITTPEYLAKTRFFKDGEEFTKEEVVNWFLFDNYWNQYL
jgi:hypothetical protein